MDKKEEEFRQVLAFYLARRPIKDFFIGCSYHIVPPAEKPDGSGDFYQVWPDTGATLTITVELGMVLERSK